MGKKGFFFNLAMRKMNANSFSKTAEPSRVPSSMVTLHYIFWGPNN